MASYASVTAGKAENEQNREQHGSRGDIQARYKSHKPANGTHSSSSGSEDDVKRTRRDDLPSTAASHKVVIAATGGQSSLHLVNPLNWAEFVVSALYILIQTIIGAIFAPARPPKGSLRSPRGHIAIVGAGLTGIASAAHFRGHGFEVTIFESAKDLGGIWGNVNSTSGLQLNSLLYRFFPTVRWSHAFPKRAEILSEIHRVADEYGLYDRIRLGTKVERVERDQPSSSEPSKFGHARWIINGNPTEIFDAIIVAVGTCGPPKRIELPGQDKFNGQIIHSSELDNVEMADKRVLVVGAGASGVEAVELVLSKKCRSISLLARSPHWVIPRNIFVGTLLAMQPFGREMPLSFIPEALLRTFHYRSVKDIAPKGKGLFTGTPIVNDKFLDSVRRKEVSFLIGDIKEVVSSGVKFSRRENGSKPGDPGKETLEKADIIILATGFERPSVDFLPKDLFPERGEGTNDTYDRPNLYLQSFSVTDWSVCLTNSAYKDAIGTAGHVHIGIYARILALFLTDEKTRPLPADSRMWVDFLRWFKRSAPAGALDFLCVLRFACVRQWQELSLNSTYTELIIWLTTFHALRVDRMKWMPFTLFGFGMPQKT